jgi:hypothetical protein
MNARRNYYNYDSDFHNHTRKYSFTYFVLFVSLIGSITSTTVPTWKGSCTGLSLSNSPRQFGNPPVIVSIQNSIELQGNENASFCAQHFNTLTNEVTYSETRISYSYTGYKLVYMGMLMNVNEKNFEWSPENNTDFCSCHCPWSTRSWQIKPCPFDDKCDLKALDLKYPRASRQPFIEMPECQICTIVEGDTDAKGCAIGGMTNYIAKGYHTLEPVPLYKLTSGPGIQIGLEACEYDTNGVIVLCKEGSIVVAGQTVDLLDGVIFRGSHFVSILNQESRSEFNENDYFTVLGNFADPSVRGNTNNLFRIPSEWLGESGANMNKIGWAEYDKARLIYNQDKLYEAVHDGIYLEQCNGQICKEGISLANFRTVFNTESLAIYKSQGSYELHTSTANLDLLLAEKGQTELNFVIGTIPEIVTTDQNLRILTSLQITSIVCEPYNPQLSNMDCLVSVTGIGLNCQLLVTGRGGLMKALIVKGGLNTFNVSVPSEEFDNNKINLCAECEWGEEKVCFDSNVVTLDPELNPEENDPDLETGIQDGANDDQDVGTTLYNADGIMHGWAIGMFTGISLFVALLVIIFLLYTFRKPLSSWMEKNSSMYKKKMQFRKLKEESEMRKLQREMEELKVDDDEIDVMNSDNF